jgi:hypothetical protein
MRKLFSIVFVLIVLISGMHLSIASHICGGKVAAIKFSFTGAMASCGMESETKSLPTNGAISTNCCHNTINFLSVDNFKPFSFDYNQLCQQVSKLTLFPLKLVYKSLIIDIPFSFNIGPPIVAVCKSRELASLCVFRI